MARLSIRKIDAEIARAMKKEKEARIWDDEPKGLGLRIKPSGTATYFIQYRSPQTFKKVRHTLGQHGRLTLDQARRRAQSLLGSVADGEDPKQAAEKARRAAMEAISVSQLCDEYMRDVEDGVVTYRGKPKKPRTIQDDRGRIHRHIKPLLGDRLAKEVSRPEIERAMHDIRLGKTAVDERTGPRGRAIVKGGAGTASRTIQLLSAIFSYAVKHNVRSDNPATGIERPPTRKRKRSLSPDEYKKLGDALHELDLGGATNKYAIHAVRVLALTGCRKGEIVGLKKTAIDQRAGCLHFDDTKTGEQDRPIGQAAFDALMEVPELGSSFVFPASRSRKDTDPSEAPIEKHMDGKKAFSKIFARAGLEGVTAHVLRHSYATVANELGYTEFVIAGLLGHSVRTVTARYVHVDRSLVAAADRVSAVIQARLLGEDEISAEVINLTLR